LYQCLVATAAPSTSRAFKPRLLKTRVGELELLVPKDRDGEFQTELFERYQRSEKALMLAILQMYVEGVSTRKVRDITEALCGLEIGKSRVSALPQKLDEEIQQLARARDREQLSVPDGRRTL
jgi:transposase-like protein